jgi:hypothetical protein
MKIAKGLLLAGAASAAPVMFMATTASAAPAQFKTVTHLANRADTCDCTTSQGDVWATDNLSRQFTVTKNNIDGTYNVVATDNGSFVAFSQPDNADPYHNYPVNVSGTIQGTIAFTVQASQGPSDLPSQIPGSESTTEMIQQMFGGIASSAIQMTNYTYTYIAGAQVYSQTWNLTANPGGTISGNIA